jgi:hypothetical protein
MAITDASLPSASVGAIDKRLPNDISRPFLPPMAPP